MARALATGKPSAMLSRATELPAPPLATLSVVTVLAVLALAACSSRSDEPTEPAIPARPALDTTRPEGLTLEVVVEGGRGALTDIRDQLRTEALRQMLPSTMADVVERLAPLPQTLAPRVQDDTRVVGLRLDDRPVVAFRIRLDDGGAPLGPGRVLTPGGPYGSLYLSRTERAIVVLYEDVAILAQTEEDLRVSLGYLVGQVRDDETERAAGLHLKSSEDYIARRVRASLEAALDEQIASARNAIQAERARHEEDPALGDPEAFIRSADASARHLLALLPDIGALRVHMGADRAGVAMDIGVDVQADSPAGRALSQLPEVRSAALGALPRGTALGVAFAPDPAAESWLAAVGEVAGDRLGESDREALTAVATGLHDRSGGTLIAGVGASSDGAFALWGAGGEGPSRELLDAMLAVRYVRTVLTEFLGCALPRRVRLGDESAALCGDTRLRHSAGEGGSLLALAEAPDSLDGTLRAIAGAASVDGTLGSDPDTARALGMAPERVLGALVMLPGHLGRVGALNDSAGARGFRRAFEMEGRPAPVAAWASREAGEAAGSTRARVHVVFTPGALDQAFLTTLGAAQLF